MLNLFVPIGTIQRDGAPQKGGVGEAAHLLVKEAGEGAGERRQQAK